MPGNLVLPMDPDDAMVAPAASELVGGELGHDHELRLWADKWGVHIELVGDELDLD